MAEKKALGKDGLLYVWQKIKALLDKKVDKVTGKQLSTNDFTDELKQKVLNAGTSNFDGAYSSLTGKPSINSVELTGNKTLTELGIQPSGNYALKSELPTVPTKVSQLTNDSGYQTAANVATAISGKADTTTVNAALADKAAKTHDHTVAQITDFPTKVSTFTNDSGYQTASQVSTAISGKADKTTVDTALSGKADKSHTHTKSQITDFPTAVSAFSNDKGYQTASQVSGAIATAVGKITSFETKVVTSLPASGVKGTIYLVASKTTGTNQTYDEYIWVNSKWEFIGTTAVDLTGYLKASELVEITNAEIDAIFSSI